MKRIRIISFLGCVIVLITLILLHTFPLTSSIMVMNLLLVGVFGFFVAFSLFVIPQIPQNKKRYEYYEKEDEKERDKCQFCLGMKGGKPGNENMIDGVITCDCCQALLMDIEAERSRNE